MIIIICNDAMLLFCKYHDIVIIFTIVLIIIIIMMIIMVLLILSLNGGLKTKFSPTCFGTTSSIPTEHVQFVVQQGSGRYRLL